MAAGLQRIELAIDAIIANFPSRLVAGLLRFFVPHGDRNRMGPSDALTAACAEIVTRRSDARDRLTAGLFAGLENEALPILERALEMTEQVEPLVKKLRDNRIHDWHAEEANAVLSDADRTLLAEAEQAVHRAIMVDDFDPKELRPTRVSTHRAEAAK